MKEIEETQTKGNISCVYVLKKILLKCQQNEKPTTDSMKSLSKFNIIVYRRKKKYPKMYMEPKTPIAKAILKRRRHHNS